MKGEDTKLLFVAILAAVAIIMAGFAIVVPEDKDDDVGEEANYPPTAEIDAGSASAKELEVIYFDGSESSDLDGIIVEYTWDFGDGVLDSGMYTGHAYSLAGSYDVSLKVIDDRGDTDTDSITITINEKAVVQNVPPVAEIGADDSTVTVGTEIQFSGFESSDSDGLIVEYIWDFDDGKFGSGVYASHSYSAAGSYDVILTVTDDEGETDTDSMTVTVSEIVAVPNEPPVAELDADATTVDIGGEIMFNGSGSSDPDGLIIEYTWDFGDGIFDSGIYTSHSYSAAGSYIITLTVMDDAGDSDTDSITVNVNDLTENVPPTAMMSISAPSGEVGESFYFNGSESADTDGEIVEYTWDFGDGTKDSGMYSNHIFQTEGTFDITLTVVDDDGASDIDYGTVTIYETQEETPTGALDFTESSQTPGRFTGSFVSLSKSVEFSNASMTIIDDSMGNWASQDPINPGYVLQIPGGMNCTYNDNNANNKIDGGDTIIVYNASTDDQIKFIYKPTGGVIAQFTFTVTTPTGALDFTESGSTPGLYIGSFVSLSETVDFPYASITISDDSMGQSASQDPINPGVTFEVSGGMNCTYYDNNGNGNIDGGDTIRCYNVESGDIITFIYKPTGEIIAQYTFVG